MNIYDFLSLLFSGGSFLLALLTYLNRDDKQK